ncbi:MAG: site-specific integrase [Candidatus Omnitrophica bacterium]|nr:site-specific integrase [Candidatus Omnitrophota bacterium]
MEQLLQAFEDNLIEIKHKSRATAKHAGTHARHFFCQNPVKDLSQVTTQMVADHIAKLQSEGVSQVKINQIIWALGKCFNFLRVKGVALPKQKYIKRKALSPLTEDDLNKINYMVNRYCFEPVRSRFFVFSFMFYTGLSVRQILVLSRRDITFKDEPDGRQCVLQITNEDINRVIRIPTNFRNNLQYHFRKFEEEINAFNLTIGKINYMCRHINKKDMLDGRRIYPKLFRISWAVRCLEQGVSLQDLQRLMGHKSIRSTRRYFKLMTKDKL